MADVAIVDAGFSGLYYANILQDLLIWRRVNVPEITDEDPNEPFNQLLRAFALVGHFSNVLIDHVAREALLPTARLKESVRSLLSLISYELKQPTGAALDVLLMLVAPLQAAGTLPARMRFSTRAAGSTPEVIFEGPTEALPLTQSDKLTSIQGYRADTTVYTDYTATLNADAGNVALWDNTVSTGNMLLLGHDSVLWDKVTLAFNAADVGDIWGSHVWEYYDGQYNTTTPTTVVDNGGGTIKVTLTSLLGASNRSGSVVRVRSLLTGQYEDVASLWDGVANYVLTGDRGRVIISTSEPDYVIGSAWKEFANVVETYNANGNGLREIGFDVPETVARRWQKTAVNGTSAYWMRLRMVNATGDAPDLTRIRIDQGNQYVLVATTQGTSITENPAASATGQANQIILSGQDDIIHGTMKVYFDEGAGLVEYATVSDLLSSTSTSRDVTLDFDEDGRAIITTGDGTNGKIPPAGNDNVALEYRRGGSANGNVGSGEVTVIRGGSPLVASATNPRSGSGWKMADGDTADDLERVKIAGPASLRTLDRALTPGDIESLALSFVASDGTSPVARAVVRAEAFGPKTVELVVVGSGGGAVAAEFLAELDTYFNGDPTDADKPGRLVLNHELTSSAFDQRVINVTLTVQGTTAVSTSKIEAAVKAHLNPIAKENDGTFVHEMSGTVYLSRIAAAAFAADPSNVDDVLVVLPAANVALGAKELPVAGVITVNVV